MTPQLEDLPTSAQPQHPYPVLASLGRTDHNMTFNPGGQKGDSPSKTTTQENKAQGLSTDFPSF